MKTMSFKAIGKQILKDCTTVSKEVKSHIVFEKKGAPYKPFNDCLNRRALFPLRRYMPCLRTS